MKNFKVAAVLIALVLALLVFYPKLQSQFQAEPPAGPYEEFGSFIPYTFGVFPQGFSIQKAGTNFIHQTGLDQFEEWYLSEQHFILLIQSQGSQVHAYQNSETVSLSRLVHEQKASLTPLSEQETSNWLNGQFTLENMQVSDFWLLSFSIDGRWVELLSNLPADELLQVAENLVPSICLNPTPASKDN